MQLDKMMDQLEKSDQQFGEDQNPELVEKFKQFTDGSYQVVVLANWEPPAGGRLADAIIRYLGADIERSRR